MSFQTKTMLLITTLIILMVMVFGLIFSRNSETVIESNAQTSLDTLAQKMSNQLDIIIQPMDMVSADLISDSDFRSSLNILITISPDNTENLYFTNEANGTISSLLRRYSIQKNFFSINVFNQDGYFKSSDIFDFGLAGNQTELIESIPWLGQALDAPGKAILLPPYQNPWRGEPSETVFGYVRVVQSSINRLSFVEVQKNVAELEKIFSLSSGEPAQLVAFTSNNEVFYQSQLMDRALLEYYRDLDVGIEHSQDNWQNPVTGESELIAAAGSDYTGIRIILVQNRSALLKPVKSARWLAIWTSLVIMLSALFFVYVFSRQISKPIRKLKEQMEATELNNLPLSLPTDKSSGHDEIKTLYNTFQNLRERLSDSMQREISYQKMHLEANFDALQAQINPHFIYNILNVLSSRGLENGDDETVEICDSIAAMLRYSTSTLQRAATIEEEIGHVSAYLMLMKKRYEHRLTYKVNVEEGILSALIPKIVLQQIAENAIRHGFESGQKNLDISIVGYATSNLWSIEIIDNGPGFTHEVLEHLDRHFASIREHMSEAIPTDGLAIGGMGLINTYTRLFLFYGNDLSFFLGNLPDGGAVVRLSVAVHLMNEV